MLFKVDIFDDNGADLDARIDQMHSFIEVAPAATERSALSELRLIQGMRPNTPTQYVLTCHTHCI